MKKTYLYLIKIMLFLLLTIPFLSPAQPAVKKSTAAVTVSSIPDDLELIFQKSCMDCHATDGKAMAMAKLNFSDWDNYKAGKQTKKAVAICKMISKGGMPPKSYREKHPENIPTASQIELICNWSKTLAAKK
jgi:cytochrome c5